ncbi:MAG: hypothetical protein COA78_23225 [Blastopirellula sp.]|nr:MAG: hypothetical protein COA78_23225 [Blastopirellula sp.]
MISEFTLVPYVGARPVTFEMTAADVEEILGPAEAVNMNDLGERDERRGPMNVRYSQDDGKVVEIGFDPTAGLLFHGSNLCNESSLVEFLLQFDPQPFEWVGFLIFLELGITATGFHDEDESQKAITVFRKGRWDEFRDEFNAYTQAGSHGS